MVELSCHIQSDHEHHKTCRVNTIRKNVFFSFSTYPIHRQIHVYLSMIQYENMACNSFSTVVCGRTNSCVTSVITIGVSYLCKVYHYKASITFFHRAQSIVFIPFQHLVLGS